MDKVISEFKARRAIPYRVNIIQLVILAVLFIIAYFNIFGEITIAGVDLLVVVMVGILPTFMIYRIMQFSMNKVVLTMRDGSIEVHNKDKTINKIDVKNIEEIGVFRQMLILKTTEGGTQFSFENKLMSSAFAAGLHQMARKNE